MTCRSRLVMTYENPCHSLTSFLVQKFILSIDQRFTAQEYYLSKIPNRKNKDIT